ncbi:restriction endonuclease subunit S [Arthrobacter psychrolactophilus]
MSLKPYPVYKDSGVNWLGQLPHDWEVRPSKSVFGLRNTPESKGDVHLTPSQSLGVLPQSEYMQRTGNKVVLALAGTTMKHVEVNDFVIHLRSFQGGIEWSGYRGRVSPAYTVLMPKSGVFPAFFKYCLKSRGYIETIASLTDQLRDGQSMRYYDFGKTPLPLPPLTDQREIVEYLDQETAEIDAFIADQEELIALLNERRAATITRAVTKGLDPTVPMKDSGVEWMGPIPKNWEVAKLGWHTSCNSGKSISAENVEVVDDSMHMYPVIGGNGSIGFAASFNVSDPVLVIGRVGALCGNVHLVTDPAWVTDNALRLTVTNRYVLQYLAHLLRSRDLNSLADKTAQPLITGTLVSRQRVPLPALKTQIEIAEYLERETTEIDAAIDDARESIALSKERRAALISAAVTGKIDVRHAMASKQQLLEGELVVY